MAGSAAGHDEAGESRAPLSAAAGHRVIVDA